MPQIPFFFELDDDEKIPLPLLVAKKWKFNLTCIESADGYLYSTHDWIYGLTKTTNVRAIWADFKRRTNLMELLASTQQLPYKHSNGKTYQMDFTTDKGLYLIAQHLRVTKSRPELDEIKQYLAKAGVFVDEARLNPEAAAEVLDNVAYNREYNKLLAEGFSPDEAKEWLDVRFKSKKQRRIITAIWNIRGINTPKDFADLTNQIHRVALGLTATRHKRQLAVKDTPRNYISAADNATIQITEFTSGLLHEHRNSLGKPELSEDIDDVRPIMDASRPEIQKAFSKKPRRLGEGSKPQLPK
ncbi:MAG: hypothetical protein K8L97_19175 [Anaerolineae bacterium]|nr:hypothetical protein [Anaerolineae bacterium]